jgi:Transglycosylase SLT domain
MTAAGGEFRARRPRSRAHMRRTLVPAGLLLALATGPAARADLVVFGDGRVVKAASYKVVEEEVEIVLPGGGSYRVDIGLVERIVEDEVEIAEVVVIQPVSEMPAIAYDLSYKPERKPLFGTPYDSLIDAEAKRNDLDAALISAVIRAESNYHPRAVSRKGARGLMQLMPATARRLQVKRPFDPVANVRGGVKYLKELRDRFDGRPELILAAYNAGERAVESYAGVPPYRETVGYVKKILSWWEPALASATLPAAALPAATGAAGATP